MPLGSLEAGAREEQPDSKKPSIDTPGEERERKRVIIRARIAESAKFRGFEKVLEESMARLATARSPAAGAVEAKKIQGLMQGDDEFAAHAEKYISEIRLYAVRSTDLQEGVEVSASRQAMVDAVKALDALCGDTRGMEGAMGGRRDPATTKTLQTKTPPTKTPATKTPQTVQHRAFEKILEESMAQIALAPTPALRFAGVKKIQDLMHADKEFAAHSEQYVNEICLYAEQSSHDEDGSGAGIKRQVVLDGVKELRALCGDTGSWGLMGAAMGGRRDPITTKTPPTKTPPTDTPQTKTPPTDTPQSKTPPLKTPDKEQREKETAFENKLEDAIVQFGNATSYELQAVQVKKVQDMMSFDCGFAVDSCVYIDRMTAFISESIQPEDGRDRFLGLVNDFRTQCFGAGSGDQMGAATGPSTAKTPPTDTATGPSTAKTPPTDTPIVHTPLMLRCIHACSVCKAALPKHPFKCNTCKIEAYCNAECQKLDWKLHKTICCPVPTIPQSATVFMEVEAPGGLDTLISHLINDRFTLTDPSADTEWSGAIYSVPNHHTYVNLIFEEFDTGVAVHDGVDVCLYTERKEGWPSLWVCNNTAADAAKMGVKPGQYILHIIQTPPTAGKAPLREHM
ncbi:hypothetical protein T484DRAFT_1855042 [Baffinella frigidus]|nr:hypothetical protein T484DRAFT_1855042 [Cryptophyta sp. CCMP2293]